MRACLEALGCSCHPCITSSFISPPLQRVLEVAVASFSGRPWASAQPPHARRWQQQQQQQLRFISEQQLSADGAQVADLFEKNMAKASRKRTETEGPRILTTRREALHMYREILRYSNLFVWKDDKGRVWRDVLRANARKEFEDARMEPDPELINKLIITGRDAVQRTVESFWSKRRAIIQEEAARQGDGLGPGRGSGRHG